MLLLIALVSVTCATEPPRLSGTDLGGDPAPDLTLTDGRTGTPVTLSALRGKVVALTFLYTQCPDICPLTAERFRAARAELGDRASEVVFVAVSTDPERDTPAAVHAFSQAHRLDQGWHYLIGTRAQLASAWSAYGIVANPDPGKPTVTHTDAVFLIDRQGRERVLLRTDALDSALVKDLRILLDER